MGRKKKLTPAEEQQIISLLMAGRTQAFLAQMFKVDQATISRLAKRVKNA